MPTYDEILNSIIVVSQALVCLPLMAVLLRWNQLKGYLRWAAAMVLFDSAMAVFMYYCLLNQVHNLPFLHLFTIVQFVFWWGIYRGQLQSPLARKIHLGSGVLFVAVAVFMSAFLQPLSENPTIARSLQSGFILFYGIAYCANLLQQLSMKQPEKNPIFWLNAGALMYFSGNLFLFIFSNYLLFEPHRVLRESWALHAAFLMVYYVLIAIGIWLSPKPSLSR